MSKQKTNRIQKSYEQKLNRIQKSYEQKLNFMELKKIVNKKIQELVESASTLTKSMSTSPRISFFNRTLDRDLVVGDTFKSWSFNISFTKEEEKIKILKKILHKDCKIQFELPKTKTIKYWFSVNNSRHIYNAGNTSSFESCWRQTTEDFDEGCRPDSAIATRDYFKSLSSDPVLGSEFCIMFYDESTETGYNSKARCTFFVKIVGDKIYLSSSNKYHNGDSSLLPSFEVMAKDCLEYLGIRYENLIQEKYCPSPIKNLISSIIENYKNSYKGDKHVCIDDLYDDPISEYADQREWDIHNILYRIICHNESTSSIQDDYYEWCSNEENQNLNNINWGDIIYFDQVDNMLGKQSHFVCDIIKPLSSSIEEDYRT